MKFAVNKVRQRAMLAYLKVLQATRRSLIAAVSLFFFLQIMVLGFIGSVVTAVWLWGPDLDSKLQILFIVFAACFLLPLLILFYIFSEGVWLKASGAAEIMASQSEK